MKFLWLVLSLFLVGCGGLGEERQEFALNITGDLTPSFGVSVDAWKEDATSADECRDDSEATWCSTTHESSLKEVRFWANEAGTDYQYYNLFMKNSDSVQGTVRLRVVRNGFLIIDRDVTLNGGQKVRIGQVDRDGDFYGVNGF